MDRQTLTPTDQHPRPLVRLIGIIAMLAISALASPASAGVLVGSHQPRVVLIEVYDMQCAHCAKMAPIIAALQAHTPYLQVRYYPIAILPNHLRASLTQASTAYVLAKAYPSLFVAFTHDAFAHFPMSSAAVYQWLAKAGLNTPAFHQAMHVPWVKTALDQGMHLLQGTGGQVPLIIISHPHRATGAIILKGEQSPQRLKEAIDALSKT